MSFFLLFIFVFGLSEEEGEQIEGVVCFWCAGGPIARIRRKRGKRRGGSIASFVIVLFECEFVFVLFSLAALGVVSFFRVWPLSFRARAISAKQRVSRCAGLNVSVRGVFKRRLMKFKKIKFKICCTVVITAHTQKKKRLRSDQQDRSFVHNF